MTKSIIDGGISIIIIMVELTLVGLVKFTIELSRHILTKWKLKFILG